MNRSQRLGATAAATAALLAGAGAALAGARGGTEPAPATPAAPAAGMSSSPARDGSTARPGVAGAALADLDAEIATLNSQAGDLRSELDVASHHVDAAEAVRPGAPTAQQRALSGGGGSAVGQHEDDDLHGTHAEDQAHDEDQAHAEDQAHDEHDEGEHVERGGDDG